MCIACLNAVCSECRKYADYNDIKYNAGFIEQTINYISENFTENITMKSTAENLGYEYHYFSSLFHRSFSINFRTFLNMFRFNYACDIIIDESKSIADICFESGFDTVRSFNNIFKAMSGVTPTQYRKDIK